MCRYQSRSHVYLQRDSKNPELLSHLKARFQASTTKSANRQRGNSLNPNLHGTEPATCFDLL